MPVVERPNRSRWQEYLAWGCGGCAILAVIMGVSAFLLIRSYVSRFTRMMTTPPPPPSKRSAPYTFSGGTPVHVTLPDSAGTLTYRHYLWASPNSYWGTRAIEIVPKAGKAQTWPLVYSPVKDVRVGLYWYRAKKGVGPFVLFRDATGDSVLDLGKREVGGLYEINGRFCVAYYAYNDSGIQGGAGEERIGNKLTSVTDAYGRPARDVSAAVNSTNRIYLGSIVRSGSKLVFKPAPARVIGKRKP